MTGVCPRALAQAVFAVSVRLTEALESIAHGLTRLQFGRPHPVALHELVADGIADLLRFGIGDVVAVPVVARHVLVPEQDILAVRRLGERPTDAQVAAEADDDDALAFLRHTVVGGVDKVVGHVVFRPVAKRAQRFLTPLRP